MNILIHPQTLRQANLFIESPGHALALSGEPGAGKGYLSQFIASTLLDIGIEKVSSHPYIRLVDASAEKSGIDAVRSIQSFLTLKVPGQSVVKRIVIVERIDLLKHEAQNALLKTLEEPPEDTVIIVTFSQPDYVLPTLHSRLQHMRVLPLSKDQIINYFENEHNKSDIIRAYHISGGQAGLMSALMNAETEHPLVSAIGTARELLAGTRYERLSRVDKLAKSKEPAPELLVDGLYRLLHAGYLQSTKTQSQEKLRPIAQRLKLVEQALNDLHNNVQAKLVLSRLFNEL